MLDLLTAINHTTVILPCKSVFDSSKSSYFYFYSYLSFIKAYLLCNAYFLSYLFLFLSLCYAINQISPLAINKGLS